MHAFQDGLVSQTICNVLNFAFFDKNKPMVASLPHLLGVSEDKTGMIDGLTPDPASHVTKLNVEPNSGLVIAAKKRIQFNVLVKRIRGQVSYFTGIQVVNYLRTIVFNFPLPQFAQALFFFLLQNVFLH